MKAIELEEVSFSDKQILELFVNIMTSDDKYSLLNRGNLSPPIQMNLSKKQKTFSDLFSQLLKSRLNFEYF